VRELAPAKVNLSLYLGPLRADGRHELLSVMQSITLCDELEMTDGERDEILCPGVAAPNLVATALAAFRDATGWTGPPQRIEIAKRIPVAAGMGGGSADAAAALRLLARRSGLGDGGLLHELAGGLGSDVAGQLRPGRVLVRGAGERVEWLADPEPFGVLVLPSRATLSTAAVYREADRLGLPRTAGELARLDPLGSVGVNDLEAAARSLEPSIDTALEQARGAGAQQAMVCGSGPTVVGLYGDPGEASRAAALLVSRGVDASAARPYSRALGGPA
jgi:4-diphosphocytidyl-2-C-methyl-D-erythritol kinase